MEKKLIQEMLLGQYIVCETWEYDDKTSVAFVILEVKCENRYVELYGYREEDRLLLDYDSTVALLLNGEMEEGFTSYSLSENPEIFLDSERNAISEQIDRLSGYLTTLNSINAHLPDANRKIAEYRNSHNED